MKNHDKLMVLCVVGFVWNLFGSLIAFSQDLPKLGLSYLIALAFISGIACTVGKK